MYDLVLCPFDYELCLFLCNIVHRPTLPVPRLFYCLTIIVVLYPYLLLVNGYFRKCICPKLFLTDCFTFNLYAAEATDLHGAVSAQGKFLGEQAEHIQQLMEHVTQISTSLTQVKAGGLVIYTSFYSSTHRCT